MSATGRPECEYRSAKREGFLSARRAAPSANTEARSAKVSYERDGPPRARIPKRKARRLPMSAPGSVCTVLFVHLRLHSEYSIVDGMVRIDDGVAAAAADKMPALALTDLSNVFGMVKFYKASRARGIKPIIGCDVWVTHDSERDAP